MFLSPNQRASIIYQVVPRKRFVNFSANILQKHTQTSPLSSENKSHLAGIWPRFPVQHASSLVYFGENHLHLAPFSLPIWALVRHFFSPKNPLLAPKTPLFNGHFAPFGHVLMPRKDYIYTIAVDMYA